MFLVKCGSQSEVLLVLLSLEELSLEGLLLGSLLHTVPAASPAQALARSGSASALPVAKAAACLADEAGPLPAWVVEEEDVPVPLGSLGPLAVASLALAGLPADFGLGSGLAFGLALGGSAVGLASGGSAVAGGLAAAGGPGF